MAEEFTLQSKTNEIKLEQYILQAKIFKIHYKDKNTFENKSEKTSKQYSR
jgi:hypothetical protein